MSQPSPSKPISREEICAVYAQGEDALQPVIHIMGGTVTRGAILIDVF